VTVPIPPLQFSAGALSYRNAVPGALTYLPDTCAAITTPPLAITAGATLSYKARYNMEVNWDGVVVEISTDNGATWTGLPPTGGYPATLSATQGNACGYPTTQGAFTGSSANAFVTASSSLAAAAGQTARIRWRSTTDGGAEELGFFLDEVQITNASSPNACTSGDFIFRHGFE
jgi:bacillopeptidase F (M6 metalloprotease family)